MVIDIDFNYQFDKNDVKEDTRLYSKKTISLFVNIIRNILNTQFELS